MTTTHNPGYRLVRLEIRNFGGYHGKASVFHFGAKGAIFSGENGAGKSTAIDAYRLLFRTTPNFNSATLQQGRNDRTVETYYLGQYGKKDGPHGPITQVLRGAGNKTTFMGVCGVFANDQGDVFSSMRLGYLPQRGDRMEWHLITAPTDLSIERDFPTWGTRSEVARDAAELGAELHPTFQAFFMALGYTFGLDTMNDVDDAFRFVDESIGVKKLSSIGEFARKHVFPQVSLQDGTDNVIQSFHALKETTAALQRIESKVQGLAKVTDTITSYEKQRASLSQAWNRQHRFQQFETICDMIQAYLVLRKQRALVASGTQQLHTIKASAKAMVDQIASIDASLQGHGAQRVQELRNTHTYTTERLTTAITTAEALADDFGRVGLSLDASTLQGYEQSCARLTTTRARIHDTLQQHRISDAQLRDALTDAKRADTEAASIVRSIEEHKTTMPANLVTMRNALAQELGVQPYDLPFIGELVRVRPDQQAWEGAANRALGAAGTEILVREDLEARALAYTNNHHWGAKIVLALVSKLPANAPSTDPNSLFRKLEIQHASPFAQYVTIHLSARARHLCVDESELTNKQLSWGITKEGGVKQGGSFVKDDRYSIKDRTRWVLGWSVEERLIEAKQRAQAAKEAHTKAQSHVEQSIEGERVHMQRLDTIDRMLAKPVAFSAIDLQGLRTTLRGIEQEIAAIDTPEIRGLMDRKAQLVAGIESTQKEVDKAADALSRAQGSLEDKHKLIVNARTTLHNEMAKHGAMERTDRADYLATAQRELQHTSIITGIREATSSISYMLKGVRAAFMTGEKAEVEVRRLAGVLRNHASNYLSSFTEETALLSSHVSPEQGYVSQDGDNPNHARVREAWQQRHLDLSTSDLPKHRKRLEQDRAKFAEKAMVSVLSNIEAYRKRIKAMEKGINAILEHVTYDPSTGSRAVLRVHDQSDNADIARFAKKLEAATRLTYASNEDIEAAAESVIDEISDDTTAVGKKRREAILALSNWFDMDVEEYTIDNDGLRHQVRVYAGRDGTSGGQGERLTMLLLGAAFSHTFGAHDHTRRTTGLQTIVLDEAFMHGSDDTAQAATELLDAIGLQMIAATPASKLLAFAGKTERIFEILKSGERIQCVPSTYAQLLATLEEPISV